MKKINKIIGLIFISLSILSCKKDPVNVLVNTNFVINNKVIIDSESISKSNNGKIYSSILLTPGKHTISINDNSKEEFIVKGSDGMLNLAQEEFVVLPIDFRQGNTTREMNIPLPVIYDSLVIYHKSLGESQSQVIKVLARPQFKYILSSSGGGRIDKNKLFIRKKWDFDIEENIPNEITVKRPSDWNLEVKRKLMHAKSFLMLAKTSDVYNVELIEDKAIIQLVTSFSK